MKPDQDADPTTDSFPITAGQPVRVDRPLRTARLVVALFAAAIVACSVGGAYIATVIAGQRSHAAEARSNTRTDRRLAALEADLARRRARQATENAQTAALLAQYRQTVCTLAGGQPGPQFDRIRRDYGCADLSSPPPSAAPTPGPPASPPAGRTPGASTGRTGASTASGHPRSTPAPHPVPAPGSSPTPAPTPSPGGLCLPLLGCL